jgi:cell division septal protein FtsQ
MSDTELKQADQRTRRRFVRRQWARRWGAWRWVLVGLLATTLLVGGTWLVFFSSVLSVEEVSVTGTSYLTPEQVEKAAGVPVGRPLARVDLQTVEARVEAMPAVEDATVSRSWPHGVAIAVEERTAVAVVTVGGTVTGMDAKGVLFRDYPQQPKDLPDIRTSGSTDQQVRRETASVVAALPPEIARQVDHLQVSSIDQITLVLRDGRTVLWGSAEESATKAKVLEVLLKRPGSTYDVSVPAQPTIRS